MSRSRPGKVRVLYSDGYSRTWEPEQLEIEERLTHSKWFYKRTSQNKYIADSRDLFRKSQFHIVRNGVLHHCQLHIVYHRRMRKTSSRRLFPKKIRAGRTSTKMDDSSERSWWKGSERKIWPNTRKSLSSRSLTRVKGLYEMPSVMETYGSNNWKTTPIYSSGNMAGNGILRRWCSTV